MGQNSARADSPHAARRRLLESHGRTEKFPTLVSRKPALKRCAFGQSWPSVVLIAVPETARACSSRRAMQSGMCARGVCLQTKLCGGGVDEGEVEGLRERFQEPN